MLDQPGSTGLVEITSMAPRNATFSPEELERVIAQAIAEHEAQKAQKAQAERSDDAHKNVINAFVKAGYKREDIVLYDRNKLMPQQPDVTVLTFDKWLSLGRLVKKGEHAVKVRGSNLRLFHKDQTEIMTVEERKEAFKKTQEKEARRETKKASKQQQPSA